VQSQQSQNLAVIAIDGGELSLGGGLLALIRPALNALEPDGMLAIVSRSTDCGMICLRGVAASVMNISAVNNWPRALIAI
jgi:hypothetical protein